MSASSDGGVRRRLFFVIVVPLALFVLVLIGRATSDAAPSTASSATSASTSMEASTELAPDDASSDSPAVSSSAAPSAFADAALAVEQLPDGAVLVDLNHASEDELRKLPGVGPHKAKAIVELRARLGSFKRVEDLARVKGFGRSTLRRLRPFVRITPR
jgi:competence protein ComEA